MTRAVLIIEDNPGIGELVSMQIKDLDMQPVLVDRGDSWDSRLCSGAYADRQKHRAGSSAWARNGCG